MRSPAEAVFALMKGDFMGHPFRGNQWSRGILMAPDTGAGSGGAPSTWQDRQRLLNDKLNSRLAQKAKETQASALEWSTRTRYSEVTGDTWEYHEAGGYKITGKQGGSAWIVSFDRFGRRGRTIGTRPIDPPKGKGSKFKTVEEAKKAAQKDWEGLSPEQRRVQPEPPSKRTADPGAKTVAGMKQVAEGKASPKTPAKPKTRAQKLKEYNTLTAAQRRAYESAPETMRHEDAIAYARMTPDQRKVARQQSKGKTK